MTTIKVGDKVTAKGYTRDDLGTGTVVALDDDTTRARHVRAFCVQWETMNALGSGWKEGDLLLVESGPNRGALDDVRDALNPLEDASTPDAEYVATMRAVIQFCEASLERFKKKGARQ